jgi:Enolase C-terminal domain-like/Mandelate racemase / muconate lactonizing enzyme, N-terminal domain
MTRTGGEAELTITGLRVRPVNIVPERSVEPAAGTIASTPLVLIDLRTREGIVGCSYARCYTRLALTATARLIEDLADRIYAVARGFAGVKLKVGGGSLGQDLEAIRAVRAAIGSDAELMVDYNQSLPVAEALDRVRALDDEGLTWIEEPTRADDYRGHAEIAAAARTPIQLDENWWGPRPSRSASSTASPTRRTVPGAASSGTRRPSGAGRSADPAAPIVRHAVALALGPAIRPYLHRRVDRQQLPSFPGQLVALLAGLDDPGRS